MSVISGVHGWWVRNVGQEGQDYAPAGAERVWKATGVGAGVGAVAGGVAGGVNAGLDEPYVDYVSRSKPLGESGPAPEQILGADHSRLLAAVQARSDGADSAARSLRYLAYLKHLSPQTSPEVLSSLFNTVENHFPKDEEARAALNLVAACMEHKPGTNAYGVFSDLLNEYHRSGSLSGASQAIQGRYGVTADDLQRTTIQLETKHTTLLGRFGIAGGVLLGAGVGAAVGAGTGALVGVLWNAIGRDEASGAGR